MKRKNFVQKALATAATITLATTACAGLAFAEDPPEKTEVWIQMDPALYAVSTPDVITGVVQPEGDIIFPESSTLQMINYSEYPVNVSSAIVTPGSMTLLSAQDFNNSEEANLLTMSIVPDNGSNKAFDPSKALSKSTYLQASSNNARGWILEAEGSENDSFGLNVEGDAKNITEDLTVANGTKAFEITWQFRAGMLNGMPS